MDQEEKIAGESINFTKLGIAWQITTSQISRYSSGVKEILLWRIVWCMKRYCLKCDDIFVYLNDIYDDKTLKTCLHNAAFSADDQTL